MTLLLVYLFVALAVSFLCSVLEAVLLSVPRSHVALMVDRGSRSGRRMAEMKADVDRPLAAILTLNTFAHTLGAAGVGAQAAMLWGEGWVGLVSFVVTILVLILSEIIPKTIGAVHAKVLAPIAADLIHWMIIVLLPVVAVCNRLSLMLSKSKHSAPDMSREEMRTIAGLALREGAINEDEALILGNLIAMAETTVESVMTPRPVVFTLREDQTVAEVTRSELPKFSRIPIVRSSLDDALGQVHRWEIYQALVKGRSGATMGELARPIHTVPEGARLSTILKTFISRGEHIFRVVDEYGASVGIVTLEDVIEALLGVEIVDETDIVADMQHLARQRQEDRTPPE
jgi:CBS domain containing-hemolysin-like protein